jgi:hypothetical protein
MVEFGLKLLDNRVSDWSSFYIDYDKLKALLKKAKDAEKKRKELEKKDPVLARHVKQAYDEERKNAPTALSRSTSATSLHDMASVQSEEDAAVSIASMAGGTSSGASPTGGFFQLVGAFASSYQDAASANKANISQDCTDSRELKRQDTGKASNAGRRDDEQKTLSRFPSLSDKKVTSLTPSSDDESSSLLSKSTLKMEALKPAEPVHVVDQESMKVISSYGSTITPDSPRRPYRQTDSSGLAINIPYLHQSESSSSLAHRVAGLFTRTRYTDRLKEAYRESDRAKMRFTDRLQKEVMSTSSCLLM